MFSPVAVTPDELGAALNGRLALPIPMTWNGARFGEPNGAEMSYSFCDLIAYAAHTRKLAAGTIIRSGTLSNASCAEVGSGCIAEPQSIENIEHGGAKTGFMTFGDTVRIEMLDDNGATLFGAIDQKFVRFQPAGAAS